jgi:hypothetical protein
MNILKKPNKNGNKKIFYYDFGRGPGQRPSTGIFIYKKPKDQIQKNHNKEALALLETKKSQVIIEKQAIGSAFIPTHKFKAFIDKDFISSTDITENFCKEELQNNIRKLRIDSVVEFWYIRVIEDASFI